MKETLAISHSTKSFNQKINITGSKSESNRLLILKYLFDNIQIDNLSNSKDTINIEKALRSKENIIDIGHAGTAMRFLTAFFSIKENSEIVLTGSSRMKQRPIKALVDVLIDLGAQISYEENDGYPPIKILGSNIKGGKVTISGGISSQYITALLLIGAKLKNGITIELSGKITSKPYINMTLQIMNECGLEGVWKNEKTLSVKPQKVKESKVLVESDWSSASYFYSLVALSENGEVTLGSYKKQSYQGDSELSHFYTKLGVKTTFFDNKILLEKEKNIELPDFIELNLNNTPDIAQTLAVTCAAKKIKCLFTGLETLRIKETDRLLALKNELLKFGVETKITDSTFEIISFSETSEIPVIKTYDDHRMAMAFAPFGLLREIKIEEPDVVVKSYPDFWEDMKKIGFELEKL